MKLTIAFLAAFLTVVIAAPLDDSKTAEILKYDNEVDGVSGYRFAWVFLVKN